MTRRILLPVFVVLLLQRCTAQERCTTPENSIGDCINVRNCPEVIQILLQRPFTSDIENYLRSLQCGFEGMIPKVCCAQRTLRRIWTTYVPEPPDVSNHPNLRLINDNWCGTNALTEAQSVHYGNYTEVLEFPWMALLAYEIGSDKPEFKCGGSLINKRYVITAAHCVTRLPSGQLVPLLHPEPHGSYCYSRPQNLDTLSLGVRLVGVRLGEHNLSTERDCDRDEQGLETSCVEKYQDFGLESVHFHRDFSPRLTQNDIALLRLNGDADFRPKNVRPICLPVGFNSTVPSEQMVLTGWGKTESGLRSEALLQAELSITSLAECAQAYRGKKPIWFKQLCAGGTTGTTGKIADACSGDSGGPLQAVTLFQPGEKFILFGIVSFGQRGCAIEGVPSVYTNVVYYMDWILNTIRS